MASSTKIKLSLDVLGEYYRHGISTESAAMASDILQENHEMNHIFYNEDQFHNHVAHHILTLFSLGATPQELQIQYNRNKTYQRPQGNVHKEAADDLRDPAKYSSYLGQEQYYIDFLIHFQSEIKQKGWKVVLNECVFSNDERGDDMLVRLFAGFLHPIIHLGFGIEFQQPAIIAEALAQAAVHDNWIGPLFIGAEKAARSQASPVSKSLLTLLAEARGDPTLLASPHWKDANKIRDGILRRAPSEMIHHASQYSVSADSLPRAIAEMTNFAIYYTGAAQRPQKAIKFDFYFMHCVNSSIFFSVFAKQCWLSAANKVRLLEWKGRNDLVMYVSRHSPELRLDEITEYKLHQPATGEAAWDAIVKRVRKHNEDGHAAKLLRAIAHGQAICRPYEDEDEFEVKGDMWLQLAHMAIDSVTGYAGKPSWIRSAGFDEAWDQIQDRKHTNKEVDMAY